MKNLMIKIVVILLATSVYFNVTQLYERKALNEQNELLQESIIELENLQLIEGDSCNKLYEVMVQVISEEDDLNQRITVCTNKVYLGDALDEISDEIQLEYDPNYDEDSLYGRMVVSLYGVDVEYVEYYEINVNEIYSNFGVDFIELEDGFSYSFTLVRWS